MPIRTRGCIMKQPSSYFPTAVATLLKAIGIGTHLVAIRRCSDNLFILCHCTTKITGKILLHHVDLLNLHWSNDRLIDSTLHYLVWINS